MRELLGTAAELLGRLIGWAVRVDAVGTLMQAVGGLLIVIGIAGWSSEAALVTLGLLLLLADWNRARR